MVRYKLQFYFNKFSDLYLQCLVIFNVNEKFLTAVDILTFKSLNYKNKPLYGCAMKNTAYFCNIQDFHNLRPLMINQVSLKYIFFEILRLLLSFLKNLAGFYFYFDETVTQFMLNINYNKLIIIISYYGLII